MYAIIGGGEGRSYGACGIDECVVYTISDGRMAAVVSDVDGVRLRPERRHLAAHREVLRRLMEEEAVLPMTFGIIADGPEAIRRVVSLNRNAILEQLARVAGKVEMGLSVVWDVPNIFEFFVNVHPELRAARDRFIGTSLEPTLEEKIELGRIFDRILNEDRHVYRGKVEAVLSSSCYEMKQNRCRNERQVMNLACLVGRHAQADFEAGVFKAASLFDDNFSVDYNGPWAPHNFVHIDLKF